MDLRETKNFDGIEEEVNHWWIRTRFNYINEIIEYYNSNNINIVEYGCGTVQCLLWIAILLQLMLTGKRSEVVVGDAGGGNQTVCDWWTVSYIYNKILHTHRKYINVL